MTTLQPSSGVLLTRPLEEVEEESLNESSYLFAELWDSAAKSSNGLDLGVGWETEEKQQEEYSRQAQQHVPRAFR